MNKWMKRRLDHFRSQLHTQEGHLESARFRKDTEAVERLERQIEVTKSEMLRVIQS